MGQKTIDKLVICKPYEEPRNHWLYNREAREFSYEPGRRPAGYLKATPNYKGFDDPGIFVELPMVNKIRSRVKAWGGGRVPRRDQHHPASAGILDRPRGIGREGLLFLPA